MMRTMTTDAYYDRAAYYRARGRRQAIRWTVLGIVACALFALAIAQVATAKQPVLTAGGGRVASLTQPPIEAANPAFVRAVEWRMNGRVRGPLLQSCMRAKCVVFRGDGGVAVVFVKRDGVWRITSMIGGGDAYRATR